MFQRGRELLPGKPRAAVAQRVGSADSFMCLTTLGLRSEHYRLMFQQDCQGRNPHHAGILPAPAEGRKGSNRNRALDTGPSTMEPLHGY